MCPTSKPQNDAVQGANGRSPTTLSMYVSTRTPLILQKARLSVFKTGDSSVQVNIRCIFDGGSHATNRLRQLLKLSTMHTETLVIKMFGAEGGRIQTCDVVSLGMKPRSGTDLELSLLTVPMICEPLSGQPVNFARERFHYLADSNLADNSSYGDTHDISILIGADQYWSVVTGNVLHGRGPTAIETKLGWVLSGPVPGYDLVESAVNLAPSFVLHFGCRISRE